MSCVDCTYYLKKIDSLSIAVSKLEKIIELQQVELSKNEAQKKQFEFEKIKQNSIIASHMSNNDSVVNQLQEELISTKRRLRKYEKVD